MGVYEMAISPDTVVMTITHRACSGGSRGGSRGSAPPLLGHDVGFLTLGPKLDPLLDPPLFFACRPKMDPPPPFKNPGSAPGRGESGIL